MKPQTLQLPSVICDVGGGPSLWASDVSRRIRGAVVRSPTVPWDVVSNFRVV